MTSPIELWATFTENFLICCYEWECCPGKIFLNNGRVSANSSRQEQNKSSICHFLHYSKYGSNRKLKHYAHPKQPYHKVHSITIQFYSNPRSLQQHQVTSHKKQLSWCFCNTCNLCCPKTSASIRINILIKLSQTSTITSWNLSNLTIIW